ncbi:MAG: hypothetical protein LBI39_01250 [Puniceicoccales bacterium]|jgi:hypothetical protein|nr:hypothetical protein [Puniceicoccales bacterium]
MRDGVPGFGFFETSAVVFRRGKLLKELRGGGDATKTALAYRVDGTHYSLDQLLNAVCGRSAAARILLWIALTIISVGVIWIAYACYVSSKSKNRETLIGFLNAFFAATPAQHEETAGGAFDAVVEVSESTPPSQLDTGEGDDSEEHPVDVFGFAVDGSASGQPQAKPQLPPLVASQPFGAAQSAAKGAQYPPTPPSVMLPQSLASSMPPPAAQPSSNPPPPVV